jgi:hypothetical protein
VPKLELDAVFEQKNDIAKSVEQELEKVFILSILKLHFCFSFALCIKCFLSRSLKFLIILIN